MFGPGQKFLTLVWLDNLFSFSSQVNHLLFWNISPPEVPIFFILMVKNLISLGQ